jgi:EXLDI family protein
MPNKTIYVSDDDLPLYEQAQDLAQGNLSGAIAAALRRYVDVEHVRRDGYDEVTVPVGLGGERQVRFYGILLGEWGHSTPHQVEIFRVYRTRAGKFAVYRDRSPDGIWRREPPERSPGPWQNFLGYIGLGEQTWGFVRGNSTLDVADSLDALSELIPPEFYDAVVDVASAAGQPIVEDLDI